MEAQRRRLGRFRALCRSRGLQCTPQRIVLFEALSGLRTHPTADQAHAAVAKRLERSSRATVYRNLEALVQIGALTKVCHPGAAVRYDVRTDLHHHLVCLRCNTIVDFDDERLNDLPRPDTSKLGFRISDCRVQVRGICRSCRQLEENR